MLPKAMQYVIPAVNRATLPMNAKPIKEGDSDHRGSIVQADTPEAAHKREPKDQGAGSDNRRGDLQESHQVKFKRICLGYS